MVGRTTTKIKNNSKIKHLYVDLQSKPNDWGNPGEGASEEDLITYSSQFQMLTPNEKQEIDFILIDGRFRVACCLKCFDGMNSNCLIAFDDFLNRPQYHVVLDFSMLSIILEITEWLYYVKNVDPPNQDLIKKYEKIKE